MSFKTSNPQCGDFFLVHIPGAAGAAIYLGQALVGSRSYFTHAGIVGPTGTIVQAQPGGAVEIPLMDAISDRTRVAYSDFALSDAERARIWDVAQSYKGTPYSFVDYAAIAGLRWFHTARIEDYVRDSKHMICSQLVDECYALAGHELFPNRAAGDVAPGDLAKLIGAP